MNQSPYQLLKQYAALLYKYKVAEVLASPQTHRRELFFLLGIFFIVLTIVICLLLLIYFQLRMPPRVAPVTTSEIRKRRKWRLFKAAVPMAAVVIGLAAGSYRSDQLSFCQSCHALKADITSWKKSAHSGVSCAKCHGTPGAFGYLMDKTKALGYTYEFFNGKAPERLTSDVNSEICLTCHGSLRKQTVEVKSIVMSHKEVVQAGYRCTDCHTQTAHANNIKPRFAGMSACLPCHDGKSSSNDCSLCHTNKTTTALRELEHFPKATFPESDFRNCRRCHKDERKCIACHGLELPHPEGWAPDEFGMEEGADPGSLKHARAAAFEKKKSCYKCHIIQECGKCHMAVGHGDNWKSEHYHRLKTETTAQLEKRCLRCHTKVKKLCVICHP